MSLTSAGNANTLGFDLSPVQEQLSIQAADTDRMARFPSDNIKVLGRHKLLGLLVPTELGGLGATALTFARTAQSIAECCASTGMIFVMHCCAIHTLRQHYKDADDILRSAARGNHLSTLACSEPGTGANFYASFAQSQELDNNYILNGAKCFVTSGGHADSYIVSTQAVGSNDAVNTALYLVARDAEGLSFSGSWSGLGLRGNSSIQMNLEHCKIPKSAIIGNQGQGLEIEMGTILPLFLLGSAAVYNGIAWAALKAVIQHAKSRIHAHTGDTISALPVIRNKIADMKIQLDACTTYIESAARSMELVHLLSAKQLSCTTAVKVTGMAMEVAGGIAYSGVLPVERHFRDAQAGVVMAPSNAMLLDLVGRAALDLPLM